MAALVLGPLLRHETDGGDARLRIEAVTGAGTTRDDVPELHVAVERHLTGRGRVTGSLDVP